MISSLNRVVRYRSVRCIPHRNHPLLCYFSSTAADDIASGSTTSPVASVTEESSRVASTNMSELAHTLRPSQVVAELDRHIVGQMDAKRAVAIAMRNRWRRKQLPVDMRKEVTPRNVLLVGPTGCGKTEVARRMAQLNEAPFIKVEATKFTEVGYHGRDVDQIIRDLMDVSIHMTKRKWTEKLREQARAIVDDRILDLLTGPSADGKQQTGRESFHDMLKQGLLDDQEISIDVPQGSHQDDSSLDTTNPTVAALSEQYQRILLGAQGGSRKQATVRKKLPISEAREHILEMELEKLLGTVDLKKEAITAVEESGIVFIDEIDKICTSQEAVSSRNADASAEGVQRDLLPLIEGTTINTKYGNVNTDYILFVASGAFHTVKPSDLLPELQGRLPIRVNLKGLTEEDLYRILTEPVANLIRQQVELIATEGVKLEFEDEAIREIARMAALLNGNIENIGARRLYTVIERIMEELSFQAAEVEKGSVLKVDKAVVEARLADVTKSTDVSKFIL